MVAAVKLLVYIGIPLVAFIIIVSAALGLIFFYKTPEAAPTDSRLRLVIDHDGGADDALAITLSLLYEKYFNGPKVVALTTTYGNVNLKQAVINSDRILKLSERQDVPIYVGAERTLISGIESDYFFGYDGLGDDGYNISLDAIHIEKVPAAVALIELSKKYNGKLVVVAIGPLTNIALAARIDPCFIDRLVHLYVGAGHIQSNEYPEPEFNADMDPESYYIVANSSTVNKVTTVPFSQVYLSLNISKNWRQDVLGEIQTPIVQALNGFERTSLASPSSSWILLDPAVAAIALDNSIVEEFRNTSNSIILCGDQRGINTNDFNSSEPNMKVVYSADVDRYKQFLISVYSSEL